MRHISNYVETDIFREIYAPAKISPDTAPHGIAESHSTERFAQIREKEWWAPRESNPAPTDYAYHYGFRHPFRVCGLDCLLSLRPARTVSTRSLFESFARDRHAAAVTPTTTAAEVSPNLSSSTGRQSELTPRQPNRRVRTLASRRTRPAKSAALTRHELEALKLNAANKKTRS